MTFQSRLRRNLITAGPGFMAGRASSARFADGTHRPFGHPKYLKGPRGYEQVATFGEVEDRYYYFVPGRDLERLDFRKLRVIYECT